MTKSSAATSTLHHGGGHNVASVVNPPLDTLYADGLSAEEAAAMFDSVVEGLNPEASEQLFSALSDEFYDV